MNANPIRSAAVAAAALAALTAAAHAAPVNLVWVGGPGASFDADASWTTPAGGAATAPDGDDALAFTDLPGAAGDPPYSVDTAAARTVGQFRFGTDPATATSPSLTRDVRLAGGTVTLTGLTPAQLGGNGTNVVALARPAGSTGRVTIDNNLLLAGGNNAPPDQRFNIEEGAPVVVNGTIGETNGSWGLRKVGLGTLVLNGSTSYTGITIAQTGLLVVNGSATGNGAYSLQGGATLAGTGSVKGTLTTTGTAASLAPGSGTPGSVGTFTIDGSASFGQPTLRFDLDAAGAGAADLLAVTGLLTIASGTKVALSVPAPLDDAAYVIATYGSRAGTFNLGNVTGLPAGYGFDYQYNGLNQIAIVPVPSPEVASPLATLALALLATRRRRSRA